MPAPPSLLEAQRYLRRVLTAPGGVAEGLRDAGDPEGGRLAALVRGDRGLAAAQRLAVYAHAYFVRIHGALARDFEELAAALGEDAFHDLVKVYLMVHPPGRPSLRDAGAALAGFLREARSAAPLRRRLPCAADLAAFEWAQLEAFDAADARPCTRAELAALPAEAWAELRLAPVPSLRVLALAWPVHALAAGRAEGVAASALRARGTTLRVWRRDERVRWREMDDVEREALAAVVAGESFAELCARVAERTSRAEAPARALALLESWLRDGLVTRADGR